MAAKRTLGILKYCPSTRNKAYHAIALDTGARPHELLNLKIKDLKERLMPSLKDQNGKVIKPECIIYQFTVTGKTGSRGLAVTNSLPYVQEWLKQHPQSQNRDAPLFIGNGHSHYKAITTGGLNNIYMKYYRKEYFPSLLNNPNVPAEDKEIIKTMLNERKWNPYVIRHSSLTLKSKKLSDQMLKQHAGWSKMSKMPSIYLHQYGTESVDELLKMDGYLPSEDTFNFNPLGLKKCGSCGTVNLPESISCSHCKLLIDAVAYQHILKEQEEKDKELQTMKGQVKEIQTLLSNPAKLLEIIRRDKENDENLR